MVNTIFIFNIFLMGQIGQHIMVRNLILWIHSKCNCFQVDTVGLHKGHV